MKKYSIFIFTIVALLSGCRKDIDRTTKDRIEEPPEVFVNCSVTGVVKDEQGQPLKGVELRLESYRQTTDDNGVFYFKDVQANQKTAVLHGKLKGYRKGTVTFIPIVNNVHFLTLTLPKISFTGKLPGIEGGNLNFGVGHKAVAHFPSDTWIREDGAPYSGEVSIFISYHERAGRYEQQYFPAPAVGDISQDKAQSLDYLGGVYLEARTSAGERLEMAKGKQVEVRVSSAGAVPPGDEGDLKIWKYHPELGFWKSETKTLIDETTLHMNLSSTGWWLAGVGHEASLVEFDLLTDNLETLPYVPLVISREESLLPFSIGHVTDKGRYKSWVPKNVSLLFQPDWGKLKLETTSFSIAKDKDQRSFKLLPSNAIVHFKARMINCDGQYVENGYFQMGIDANLIFPFETHSLSPLEWNAVVTRDSIVEILTAVDLKTGSSVVSDDLIFDRNRIEAGDLFVCDQDRGFLEMKKNDAPGIVAAPVTVFRSKDSSFVVEASFLDDVALRIVFNEDFNASTRVVGSLSIEGEGYEILTGKNVVEGPFVKLTHFPDKIGEHIKGSISLRYQKPQEEGSITIDLNIVRQF